jgi:hypothetical protein
MPLGGIRMTRERRLVGEVGGWVFFDVRLTKRIRGRKMFLCPKLSLLVLSAGLGCAYGAAVAAGDNVGLPAPTSAAQGAFPAQKHFSPYAGRNFPTQVFWGDTHLHTGMSMDAGAFGARLLPEDAYRFARGEELTSSTGLKVKLKAPLDFLVVADHSDNMGFFPDSTRAIQRTSPIRQARSGTRWFRPVDRRALRPPKSSWRSPRGPSPNS